MIIIDKWVLLVVAVVFILLAVDEFRLRRKVEDLDDAYNKLDDWQKSHIWDYIKVRENVADISKDVSKHRGSMELMYSGLSNRVSELEKTSQRYTGDHYAVLIRTLEKLIEVVDNLCDRESEDWVRSENRGIIDPLKPILDNNPEELHGDPDGDEIIPPPDAFKSLVETFQDTGFEILGYRWIFPSKETHCEPTIGEWYMVVGRIEGKNQPDGAPLLCSEEALATSYGGFLTKNDEHFTEVYAYIKMPDSGDIMEQIVDIALKKKE